MPPERQTAQKRRHLPFKPPSRASGDASASASASTSGPSKAAPKPKKITKPSTTATSSKTSKPTSRTTKPKPAKLSSSRQRPSPSPSNSNSASASNSNPADADADADAGSASGSESDNEASEANYILAEITHPEHNSKTEDVLSSDPLIPPKLLTKLVHHHFKNEKTKIAKDANGVVAKYIDVFVREAVARAAFERAEGGAGGDGFLEVEDLEKMGPQLAMDF
ncbi:CENP-X/MHF2 family protein [Aspergillus stella-maris]|uniref:CENP-X/MHF2 family protein n=1 Tax=Aspergillus stella-maris TaxID=1810926 RepID=UPI003CCD68EE